MTKIRKWKAIYYGETIDIFEAEDEDSAMEMALNELENHLVIEEDDDDER